MSGTSENKVLVGDIGGTHSRFAVVDVSEIPRRIDHRRDLAGEHPSFDAALRCYLDEAGLGTVPNAIAVAVAGPVSSGIVELTNRAWRISEQDLRNFGFHHALLINDFAALTFSVSTLGPGDVHTLGPDIPGFAEEPISILGAGTGFGAACLGRFRSRAVPIATEGGHCGFAPSDNREAAILSVLARRFGHVSIERVLSGPGLENLYGALANVGGRQAIALRAPDIIARRSEDPNCREAIEVFCGIYGAVAGDFALAYGARGGVFLAGGVAQKIEKILVSSNFRDRFEQKGRLSRYVKAIPTRLILSEDATYLGTANASFEFRDGGRS